MDFPDQPVVTLSYFESFPYIWVILTKDSDILEQSRDVLVVPLFEFITHSIYEHNEMFYATKFWGGMLCSIR